MSSKPYIIGISGGSGSGKTTFINKLKTSLIGKKVSFIHQDDYYLPRDEQLTDSQGVKNFDLPSSIKIKALNEDLEKLIAGETVTKMEYTFNNDTKEAKSFDIVPANILVIEGLFIYHYEELRKYFDLKIFVEANDELKLLRRIKRDRVERNYPLEDVTYRYEHHVMPAYRAYIEPHKGSADIVINNNDNFEEGLKVVNAFINSLC